MRSDFTDFVVEQMAGLDGVRAKRMFGGHGIFRDGLMFALIAGDTLYFKADEASIGRFQERGLGPFTYEARGKEKMSLRYFRAPEEVFDDAQAMTEWAREAFECALRNRKPAAKAAPRRPAPRSGKPAR